MVAPTAGAVVLVSFPFSDLSQAKLRPAVLLADAIERLGFVSLLFKRADGALETGGSS